MALTNFLVKEGYAFFHLDKNGTRLKSTPAGGVVALLDKNQFDQSWKLHDPKPVRPPKEDLPPEDDLPLEEEELQTPPNDMNLIEGFKGNVKLAELLQDHDVITFAKVVELEADEVAKCFKGNKEERTALAKKFLESAYNLAGMG